MLRLIRKVASLKQRLPRRSLSCSAVFALEYVYGARRRLKPEPAKVLTLDEARSFGELGIAVLVIFERIIIALQRSGCWTMRVEIG